MKNPSTIVQMLIRGLGVVVLILGLVLWIGHGGAELQRAHQTLGIILVLLLWTLAALAAKAGVRIPLVVVAVVWGLLAPIVGFAQKNIMAGSGHWVIRVVHLLIGLGVIGLGESLGANIKVQSAKTAR